MNADQFALQAKNISYTYPEGSLALSEVDFQIHTGEFVSLLASNGSGKTTLIKALAGVLKPQKGTIRIDGKLMSDYAPKELYQRIGVVLQNPNDQLFAATVEDDVAFGPRNLKLSEPEVQKRVKEALELVSAGHLCKRAIHHLSFGEQKRVAIAGVLAMSPEILILDEPTAGLDPAGESTMMEVLSRLNRNHGISILLTTHLVDMLPLFSDRIYVLQNGKVLLEGTPEAVFCNHDLIKQANLRLPYISSLLHELKKFDGVPIGVLPLTVREARLKLLELIPDELLAKTITKDK